MEKKDNKARELFLKNYIQDENWYNRADQYTSKKFDTKQKVLDDKRQKKAEKDPTWLGTFAAGFMDYFGGMTGLQLFFFFALNIVLASYNFYNAARGMTFWYVSMGTYYVLLAILRFLIMDPKPRCFHAAAVHPYWVRRWSSMVFFLLGSVLPFILYFSLSYFSHARNDALMVFVFMIYTFFKISALLSQFVASKLQGVDLFSPLNCVTNVELMMALLTLERFWLGNSGDDSFGLVFFLNIVTGIVCIVLILILGVYSGFAAKELRRSLNLENKNLKVLMSMKEQMDAQKERMEQHQIRKEADTGPVCKPARAVMTLHIEKEPTAAEHPDSLVHQEPDTRTQHIPDPASSPAPASDQDPVLMG